MDLIYFLFIMAFVSAAHFAGFKFFRQESDGFDTAGNSGSESESYSSESYSSESYSGEESDGESCDGESLNESAVVDKLNMEIAESMKKNT